MSCCCCRSRITKGKKSEKKTAGERSGVPLLFYLYVPGQYGGYFPLHEGPGHVGAHQRAPLAAGAVHLAGGALLLDALPGAGEAELVRWHRRALDKVSVLQPLMAQSAAQRHAARWDRRVWNALWWRCMGVHAAGRVESGGVGAHGSLPLGQPPLRGRGRRQGAAAVPPRACRGGVYLVGVLG